MNEYARTEDFTYVKNETIIQKKIDQISFETLPIIYVLTVKDFYRSIPKRFLFSELKNVKFLFLMKFAMTIRLWTSLRKLPQSTIVQDAF